MADIGSMDNTFSEPLEPLAIDVVSVAAFGPGGDTFETPTERFLDSLAIPTERDGVGMGPLSFADGVLSTFSHWLVEDPVERFGAIGLIGLAGWLEYLDRLVAPAEPGYLRNILSLDVDYLPIEPYEPSEEEAKAAWKEWKEKQEAEAAAAKPPEPGMFEAEEEQARAIRYRRIREAARRDLLRLRVIEKVERIQRRDDLDREVGAALVSIERAIERARRIPDPVERQARLDELTQRREELEARREERRAELTRELMRAEREREVLQERSRLMARVDRLVRAAASMSEPELVRHLESMTALVSGAMPPMAVLRDVAREVQLIQRRVEEARAQEAERARLRELDRVDAVRTLAALRDAAEQIQATAVVRRVRLVQEKLESGSIPSSGELDAIARQLQELVAKAHEDDRVSAEREAEEGLRARLQALQATRDLAARRESIVAVAKDLSELGGDDLPADAIEALRVVQERLFGPPEALPEPRELEVLLQRLVEARRVVLDKRREVGRAAVQAAVQAVRERERREAGRSLAAKVRDIVRQAKAMDLPEPVRGWITSVAAMAARSDVEISPELVARLAERVEEAQARARREAGGEAPEAEVRSPELARLLSMTPQERREVIESLRAGRMPRALAGLGLAGIRRIAEKGPVGLDPGIDPRLHGALGAAARFLSGIQMAGARFVETFGAKGREPRAAASVGPVAGGPEMAVAHVPGERTARSPIPALDRAMRVLDSIGVSPAPTVFEAIQGGVNPRLPVSVAGELDRLHAMGLVTREQVEVLGAMGWRPSSPPGREVVAWAARGLGTVATKVLGRPAMGEELQRVLASPAVREAILSALETRGWKVDDAALTRPEVVEAVARVLGSAAKVEVTVDRVGRALSSPRVRRSLTRALQGRGALTPRDLVEAIAGELGLSSEAVAAALRGVEVEGVLSSAVREVQAEAARQGLASTLAAALGPVVGPGEILDALRATGLSAPELARMSPERVVDLLAPRLDATTVRRRLAQHLGAAAGGRVSPVVMGLLGRMGLDRLAPAPEPKALGLVSGALGRAHAALGTVAPGLPTPALPGPIPPGPSEGAGISTEAAPEGVWRSLGLVPRPGYVELPASVAALLPKGAPLALADGALRLVGPGSGAPFEARRAPEEIAKWFRWQGAEPRDELLTWLDIVSSPRARSSLGLDAELPTMEPPVDLPPGESIASLARRYPGLAELEESLPVEALGRPISELDPEIGRLVLAAMSSPKAARARLREVARRLGATPARAELSKAAFGTEVLDAQAPGVTGRVAERFRPVFARELSRALPEVARKAGRFLPVGMAGNLLAEGVVERLVAEFDDALASLPPELTVEQLAAVARKLAKPVAMKLVDGLARGALGEVGSTPEPGVPAAGEPAATGLGEPEARKIAGKVLASLPPHLRTLVSLEDVAARLASMSERSQADFLAALASRRKPLVTPSLGFAGYPVVPELANHLDRRLEEAIFRSYVSGSGPMHYLDLLASPEALGVAGDVISLMAEARGASTMAMAAAAKQVGASLGYEPGARPSLVASPAEERTEVVIPPSVGAVLGSLGIGARPLARALSEGDTRSVAELLGAAASRAAKDPDAARRLGATIRGISRLPGFEGLLGDSGVARLLVSSAEAGLPGVGSLGEGLGPRRPTGEDGRRHRGLPGLPGDVAGLPGVGLPGLPGDVVGLPGVGLLGAVGTARKAAGSLADVVSRWESFETVAMAAEPESTVRGLSATLVRPESAGGAVPFQSVVELVGDGVQAGFHGKNLSAALTPTTVAALRSMFPSGVPAEVLDRLVTRYPNGIPSRRALEELVSDAAVDRGGTGIGAAAKVAEKAAVGTELSSRVAASAKGADRELLSTTFSSLGRGILASLHHMPYRWVAAGLPRELVAMAAGGETDAMRQVLDKMLGTGWRSHAPTLVEDVLDERPEPAHMLHGAGPSMALVEPVAPKLSAKARKAIEAAREMEAKARAAGTTPKQLEERRRRQEQVRRAAIARRKSMLQRTLELAEALFPHQVTSGVGQFQHAPTGPMTFPGLLEEQPTPVDLTLVAPMSQQIELQAAPLYSKEAQDKYQTGTDTDSKRTLKSADKPGKLDKFMSPEQLDMLARKLMADLQWEIMEHSDLRGVSPFQEE